MNPEIIAALLQRLSASGGGMRRADTPSLGASVAMQQGVNDLWGPREIMGDGPPPDWRTATRPVGDAAPPYYLAQPRSSDPGYGSLAYGGSAADQAAAERVTALINGLETQPSPTLPKRSTGNKILGALGDALSNYGSVRSGGPVQPMGQYGSGVQQERLRFQSASEEAAKNNAAIRNQMRLAAMQSDDRERLARIQGEYGKEEAEIRSRPRPPIRVPTTVVDGKTGQNVRVVDWFDGDTGTFLRRTDQGEAGYAPAVMPGMEVGADGEPDAGIFRVPKSRGAGTERVTAPGGRRLEPMPSSPLAAEAGGKGAVLERVPDVMDVFNRAAESVGGDEGYFNGVQNWVQGQAAKRNLGRIVGAPPQLTDYFNSVKSVLFPIVKTGSGVNFSYQELDRWESRFPLPGFNTPEEAEHAWQVLIDEMISDVKSKYAAAGRTPPKMANPRVGKAEDFSTQPPMSRATFNSLKPSEQKRWTDGGGKVGQ